MARLYEYAVLTAVPNPRRGERVNIGIIVFRPDRIDVRFKQAEYKLRALTGENWKLRIQSAEETFTCLFDPTQKASEAIEKIKKVDPFFQPSSLGFLRPEDESQYDDFVEKTLVSLVAVEPKREKTPSKTRINTEIARDLSKAKILAKNDETIEDHKIVRGYSIDQDEGLIADFALKNGKLMVAATLDLRKQADLGEAALKSITLDKAEKKFTKDGVRTVGVYAVDQDMRENFKSHIAMLGDYAHELYDWSDVEGKRKFKKSIFDALHVAGGELL